MGGVKKKVCILGDAGVGKTSIVRKLIEGKYRDEYQPTVGTSMSNFEVGGDGSLTLMIWDITGQPGYPHLREIFFKKATGAILAIDVTNRDSLSSIVDWVTSLYEVEFGIPLVVAMNKIDSKPHAFGLNEVRSALEGYEYDVFMTSAKGGQGITELFQAIAAKVGGM